MAISEENLFVGTDNGVFYSTNKGANWTAVNNGLWNTNVFSFAITGMNIFVGTLGGVFHSTNNGTNWVNISSGLTNANVFALGILGKTIYAGVNYAISYRPLSELITSAKRSTSDLFSQFNLSKTSYTTLKIYDVTGRVITTLVDGELLAGTYTKVWDANNCPSGSYYYTIQSGNYKETKKLILQK